MRALPLLLVLGLGSGRLRAASLSLPPTPGTPGTPGPPPGTPGPPPGSGGRGGGEGGGGGGGHPGVCPNQLNPNLWVDAQSTCERDCRRDTDCEDSEKCCTNVCGLRSCVAARFAEGGPAGRPAPAPAPAPAASCDGLACPQQGSDCDVWDGQPVCRCRDRCEKEPDFTCASDGLTYYNRCYLDAEACLRGLRLAVVPCKHVSSWPPSSPGPPGTSAAPPPPAAPTPGAAPDAPVPPVLYSNPAHRSVPAGGTVSFHCDVSGRPPPDITWEKQGDQRERSVMRPDRMYGNVVVTNIGQLVVYDARPEDAGLYTCTARNAAGLLRADFPLSVIQRREREPEKEEEDAVDEEKEEKEGPPPPPPTSARARGPPPPECLREPERRPCPGPARVRWRFDARRGACATFLDDGACGVARGNRFETYEACQRACVRGPGATCTLPAVQGPCQRWEPRWAYSPLLRRCHSFVYGGCEGNGNNFESRERCEDACPFPRAPPCKACRLRSKMAPSLCRSDFAIVGRLTEVIEEPDSGLARFALDDVLKDDKMGLKFFDVKYLEVTLTGMDWGCPCPNMTAGDGPLVIMGEVRDGVAVLHPGSYVRAASDKRLRKISELIDKRTCELLNRFRD
ncbi:WAP, Kazal, immunoglobulin, Kunitz and NTR domain-containing protein 1 [Ornithorhynchus anatinus]|uniref:WAP, follistatin/kazal, immunoglobulin, kunitz and netrin domain containing 1 n=1 Tax=Ornithorhynchus anatinus TaxID=9258 RepID=A0A6I8PCI8_ORNAN|nr:WAP, Kazal, immunoglobulin, Kunitz and NTR domain-containing protein 1 [Ornithorhynchus anatinus]